MGEIADAMINGKLCVTCGAYLEPGEKVYLQNYEKGTSPKVKMPKDGSEFGVPVNCTMCHE